MMDAGCRYHEWQTKDRVNLPHLTKHTDGKVVLVGLYEESIDKSITFLSALALV